MEFVTAGVTRQELLGQLIAFIADAAATGAESASLSYGWDSAVGLDEMWRPFTVSLSEVVATVLDAEANQIVRLGESDIFIEVANTRLTLCHEGGLHVSGEGELVAQQVARWRATGLSPMDTANPSSNAA